MLEPCSAHSDSDESTRVHAPLNPQALPSSPRVRSDPAPASPKPLLKFAQPLSCSPRAPPRSHPIVFSTGPVFPSFSPATPAPVQPCYPFPSPPSALPRVLSLATWCSPLGGGVGLRTAQPCLQAEGSLLQTPARRYCSSVPCRLQGLLGTSPTLVCPGPRARIDQRLALSPLTSCGLGCVLLRRLSSLANTLIGFGVSVSPARPALVVRGAFR